MMKRYSMFATIIVAMICMLAISLISIGFNTTSLPPDCSSRVTLFHGNIKYDANYHFIFVKSKGDVMVKGIIHVNNKNFTISRQISFSYLESNNNYLLTNRKIDVLSSDNAAESGIENHLPGFFSKVGSEFLLTLKRDQYRNPVFFMDETPLFFCRSE